MSLLALMCTNSCYSFKTEWNEHRHTGVTRLGLQVLIPGSEWPQPRSEETPERGASGESPQLASSYLAYEPGKAR